jgi:hypothetical protein
MPINFIPGNRDRELVKKYLYYAYREEQGLEQCQNFCSDKKVLYTATAENNPYQTENQRISQALTGTLGGKLTFGNRNRPVPINAFGKFEGQPGGSGMPIRNRF